MKSYGAKETPAEAFVEAFAEGQTAVIHESGKVACIIDLSEIAMAPLTHFRYAHFESEQMNDYARLELIGADRMLQLGPARVRLVRC